MIGSDIIPGSLPHLLYVTDGRLAAIYQSYGFYRMNTIDLRTPFLGFIEGFNILIGITRFKNLQ
jgi:hypothetical protein